MSWRIYFENVLYFSITFPTFVGQYHIYQDIKNPYAKCNHEDGKTIDCAQKYINNLLDEIVDPESTVNAGMMHTYTPGELTLFGYDFGMHPTDGNYTTEWLNRALVEPLRVNVARIQAWGMIQVMVICLILTYRVRGFHGWFQKEFLATQFVLFKEVMALFFIAFIHDLETSGEPASNKAWNDARSHMGENYDYQGYI